MLFCINQIYESNNPKTFLLFEPIIESGKQLKLRILAATILVFFMSASPSYATSNVDVSSGQLNFGADSGTSQQNDIGLAVGLNFNQRYANVFNGVDAVVTVIDVSNIDSDDDESNGVNNLIDVFDESDVSTGQSINTRIDITGESPNDLQSGFVTYRVDFVQAGTNNAITLQNISVNVADIDSNQYVSFSGISAYELSSSPSTELTATSANGIYEFKETQGFSSGNSDQENWVLVEFSAANSITFTMGARESGGAFFGVSFVDATWTNSPTRPALTLTPFDVAYNSNNADSGAVPTTQSSTSNSSAVTLAAPQGTLSKATCTFSGWNTRADGTGANYVSGNTLNLTSNLTLYANWSCIAPASSSSSASSELAQTGANPSLFPPAITMVLAGIALLAIRKVSANKSRP